MKILLITLSGLLTGCVLAVPPSTKITLNIKDFETGVAVSNAIVRTGYTLKNDPWGAGVGKSTRVEEPVDKLGFVVLEGRTISNERGGSIFAEGYYNQMYSIKYTVNVALNRWEPWNPTIEIKVRPKITPVPMVYKRVEALKIPAWSQMIGFDLEKGDWVAPYGKGKRADFFVNMYRRFEHSSDYDAVATITFPNEGDGIQLYEVPEEFKSSSFKFPYEAPTNNYQEKLVLERHATLRSTKCSFNPDKDLYIFRVRTKLDESGEIVSACYGRIDRRIEIGWGDVLDFSYSLNNNPESRSLESDK